MTRPAASGERTLPACWSPHPAATNFPEWLRRAGRSFRNLAGVKEVRFGRMPKPPRWQRALPGFPALSAFTIIELLVVMAVIIILAGLVLVAAQYVQNKGYRARAEAEIAAISAALENYKADNGIYPRDVVDLANPPTPIPKGFVAPYNCTDSLNARNSGDPSASEYQNASRFLYGQLSGDKNFDRTVDALDKQDPANSSEPIPKSYFAFKPSMLSPSTGAVVIIRDPFGNSYGYSTANQLNSGAGYNPTFDLWSTAGQTNTAQWIKNW